MVETWNDLPYDMFTLSALSYLPKQVYIICLLLFFSFTLLTVMSSWYLLCLCCK